MVSGIYQRSFIGRFQVKIHILLDKALPVQCNTIVKHNLIFKFRDSRTFNRCGMGYDGVQIELVIAQLTVYAKFTISPY